MQGHPRISPYQLLLRSAFAIVAVLVIAVLGDQQHPPEMAAVPLAPMAAAAGIVETPLPPLTGAPSPSAQNSKQCLNNGQTSVVISNGDTRQACKPGCVYQVAEVNGSTRIQVIGYHPDQPQGVVVFNSGASVYQKTCISSGDAPIVSVFADTGATAFAPYGSASGDVKGSVEIQQMENDLSAGQPREVGADSWTCSPGDNGPSCPGGSYYGSANSSGALQQSAAVSPSAALPEPPPPAPPPPSVQTGAQVSPFGPTGVGEVPASPGAITSAPATPPATPPPGVLPSATPPSAPTVVPTPATPLSAPVPAPPVAQPTPPIEVPLPGDKWIATPTTTIVVKPNPLQALLLSSAWARSK